MKGANRTKISLQSSFIWLSAENMASNEINNNLEKITEDLQAIDISDGVEIQPKADWTLPCSSIEAMYDPQLLKFVPSVDEVTSKCSTLVCRPLQSDDYIRGFITLLGQLTNVGSVTESDFKKRFNSLKKCIDTYYNTVIVDKVSDQIIGSATLIVEKKFIHNCATRGVIEEVIVSDQYRGKSLGKHIVNILVELGQHLGCYKITLNCSDQMLPFYKRLKFDAEKNNANFLVIRVSKADKSDESSNFSQNAMKVFDDAKPREAWGDLSINSEKVDVMFDPALLEPILSIAEVRKKDSNLDVRPLQSDDFKHGIITLLEQLTSVGNITESNFRDQFKSMKLSNGTYYQTVIVNEISQQIIGSATLIIEKKFIHDCANRGLIEDVVISDQYRGKSLGKLIVNSLIELGKSLGCYKITLNCKDDRISFYENLGFKAEEGNANFLVIRVSQS